MSPVLDLCLGAFTFKVLLHLFVLEWINLYFGLFYPFTLLVVLCAARERVCDSALLSSDTSQQGKQWN